MLDVITIDGPAASGKSTVGLQFAQKHNFRFIDSGAIFRAGAYVIKKTLQTLDNEQQNAKIFQNLNLKFKVVDGKDRVFLDDEDVTEAIHTPEISEVTSLVAAQRLVREVVKEKQHQLAAEMPTVIAGRDIGSEIFPDAKLKFYISASDEVRARRRFEQLQKKGSTVSYEEILQQTRDRDYRDAHREVSPMRIPEDAIVIDTSAMTVEQAVTKMEEFYPVKRDSGV